MSTAPCAHPPAARAVTWVDDALMPGAQLLEARCTLCGQLLPAHADWQTRRATYWRLLDVLRRESESDAGPPQAQT